MKRSIAVIIGVCLAGLFTPQLRAQSLLVGASAGIDFATANTDESVSLTSKKGLVAGAGADLIIGQGLGFHVGVQYDEKGTHVEQGATLPTDLQPGDYNLNYLNFPIGLKYTIGKPSFNVFVTAGTTVGTLLSAALQQSSGGGEIDIKNQYNPIDLSLDLGLGFGFEIAKDLQIVTQAVYSLGVTDAAKDLTSTDSWKGRSLKITTGFQYDLF
jgi:hypothetical protein